MTKFLNQIKQYRNAPKQIKDLKHEIEKIDIDANNELKKSYYFNDELRKISNKFSRVDNKRTDEHSKGNRLSDKEDQNHILRNDRKFFNVETKLREKFSNTAELRDKSEENTNDLLKKSQDQFIKKQDLENELESNPFMKTDKFIRAHQTPIKAAIKAALAVPVVGGTIYSGKKVVDHLKTPAPVVTPPVLFNRENATPDPVVPPPNHFSDNAGKYGAALGGVAAAGLGALALRKYLKKKKKEK